MTCKKIQNLKNENTDFKFTNYIYSSEKFISIFIIQ